MFVPKSIINPLMPLLTEISFFSFRKVTLFVFTSLVISLFILRSGMVCFSDKSLMFIAKLHFVVPVKITIIFHSTVLTLLLL